MLGPLSVLHDGTEVAIAGARQRALLAYLLLHANRVVPTDRLIDELFGDEAHESALNSVHTGISRLRRQFSGAGVDEIPIVTRPPGYLLELAPGQLDLNGFEDLLRSGRSELDAGKPHEARETLGKALELWRGEALADLSAYAFARDEAARLEDLHLTAMQERIEADLALGRHAEVVGELERLIAQHPLQERLREQLMLALYRAGRQSDALELYQDTRRHLIAELGLEPGPALRDLEQAILVHDPRLAAPKRIARPAARRGTAVVAATIALLVAALVAAVLLRGGGGETLSGLTPNSVGVLDPAKGAIVADVPIGGPASRLVAGAGGLWTLTDDGKLLVKIDPEERRATTYGLSPPASDLAADAQTVWLLQGVGGSGQVSRFNPRVEAVVDDPLPTHHDFNMEDRLGVGGPGVWVTHSAGPGPGRDVLIRVDARRGKTPSETQVGQAVDLTLDAAAIWVLHSRSEIDRIDGKSGDPEGVIKLGQGWAPQSVAVGFGAVWVSAASVEDCPASFGPGSACPTGKPGRLFRLDPTSNTIAAEIPVEGGPAGIAVGVDGVWLADCCKHVLQRIDPLRNRIVATIALGADAGGVAVSTGRVWVAAY